MTQFYKTEEEFSHIHTNLKLFKCQHCKCEGCLILHGYLYGYAEGLGSTRIKRGRRIFCSNRKNRKGCGKTFSFLMASFIKNFIISTNTLWKFLNKISQGYSLASAFRSSNNKICESCIYGIFKKFKYNQVRIRSFLTRIKTPPKVKTKNNTILTIYHLKSVFGWSYCPISEFQHYFQTSFL